MTWFSLWFQHFILFYCLKGKKALISRKEKYQVQYKANTHSVARYVFLRDFTVFNPLAFFHFWLLGWPSVKSFLIPAVMTFNPELPTFDLAVPRHKLMNTKLSSMSESHPAPELELVFSSLVNPELFSTLASSCLSLRIAEQLLILSMARVQIAYAPHKFQFTHFSFSISLLPSTQGNYGGFLWGNIYIKELFFSSNLNIRFLF